MLKRRKGDESQYGGLRKICYELKELFNEVRKLMNEVREIELKLELKVEQMYEHKS